MAEQTKIGLDWQADELDLIVQDYFVMLSDELANRPYVKSHRSSDLMRRIGRTHRSVEYKHMNISAVLAELALPTIRGYRPKANYQRALVGAVERFLSQNAELLAALDMAPETLPVGVSDTTALFEVPPPVKRDVPWLNNQNMLRLVTKFDPAERDAKNRALGLAGEELVVNFERHRLLAIERQDLARKVRWVSQEDGDGAGYDILSFSGSGEERLIEVKTTRGRRTTPFFLSRNEHDLGHERPDVFRLCRVFDFSHDPAIFRLRPPLEDSVTLTTQVYRASF